jgi:hypothetical protein
MNKLLSKESIVYIWLGILSILLLAIVIKLNTKSAGLNKKIDVVAAQQADSFAQMRQSVKSKEFLLVDEAGAVRAKLHFKAASPKDAVLLLSDPDSNSMAELGIINHAPQFSLSDKKGDRRILLSFAPDKEEQAFLKLAGKNGGSEVQLAAQTTRPSGLFLYGKDSEIRSQLSLANNRPTLYFFDQKGNARLSFGVTDIFSPDGTETKTSESTLYLFDHDGKPVWHAP